MFLFELPIESHTIQWSSSSSIGTTVQGDEEGLKEQVTEHKTEFSRALVCNWDHNHGCPWQSITSNPSLAAYIMFQMECRVYLH